MHAAAAAPTPRKRDVERLGGEPRRELCVGQRAAARLERRLYALLGGIEGGAGGLSFLGAALRTEGRKLSAFAQIAGLGVLQRCGIAGRGEIAERALDDFVQGANG
jgi:hypothetical protein